MRDLMLALSPLAAVLYFPINQDQFGERMGLGRNLFIELRDTRQRVSASLCASTQAKRIPPPLENL
jgi:hypothetical protein